ncbi:MAG: hypothetical protein LBG27_08715 [Spirochaetaceae bacterium]|jgi:hypothetical protein|nr:hypothetical protein [Spirochaetaceae bacterium]
MSESTGTTDTAQNAEKSFFHNIPTKITMSFFLAITAGIAAAISDTAKNFLLELLWQLPIREVSAASAGLILVRVVRSAIPAVASKIAEKRVQKQRKQSKILCR